MNGAAPNDLALHRHVLDGNETALDEIAKHILPRIRRRLRSRFGRESALTIEDAAEDAFVEYALTPHRFDPTRGVSIETFLYWAAWRNVCDAQKAAKRRRAREAVFASFIRDADERTRSWNDGLAALRASLASEVERRALDCWLGEQPGDVLPELLGIYELSISDQQSAIKRFRDRVMKRLHRKFESASRATRRRRNTK